MERPNRKVGSGALAGALSVILVFCLNEYAGAELTAEIASAITTVLTFVVSYFVPNKNGTS